MSPLPIALVILSALAHATWNFITKRAHASQAFMALATLAEVIVFLPVFVIIGIPSPLPPADLWWMFAIASTYNPLFFFFIGRAYQRGNLSLVYPVARAGSLLFLPIIAGVFLGEQIGPIGGIALLLIIAGIVILQLKALTRKAMQDLIVGAVEPATGYALAAALIVSIYLVWDKYALQFLPLFYYYYVYTAVSGVVYVGVVAATQGAQVLIDEVRRNPRDISLVGLLTMGGYLMLLTALRTDNASYVVALRQLSIGIGALMGKFWLGEDFGGHKWLGLAILLGGCVLISMA